MQTLPPLTKTPLAEAIQFARQKVMSATKEFHAATTPGVKSYWAGRLKQARQALAELRRIDKS